MSQETEYLIFYVFGSSQILKKSAVVGSGDYIYKNFQLYIQKRLNIESYSCDVYFMKAHLGYYPNRNGDICTFVLIRCYSSNTNYFLEKRKLESPAESFFLRYEKQVTLENYSILQRRFRNKTYLDFSDLEKEGLFYFFQTQHSPILNGGKKIENPKPSYPMIELIEKEETPKSEISKDIVVKDIHRQDITEQKTKEKMEDKIEKFGLDFFDEWQKIFIKTVYDIFNKEDIKKFGIDWVIASGSGIWIKVLQIVKYITYDDPKEDWILIKDPENYEKVVSIILLNGVTSFKNIIFLLTKEPCPEFHSFIQEISNGIVFLENEAQYFQNPYILVFSKYTPIVCSPEIIKGVYHSIEEIREDGTFESTTFKIEELI